MHIWLDLYHTKQYFLHLDNRTRTEKMIANLFSLLKVRDMNSQPIASHRVVYVGVCVCTRCIHSDNYYTARLNKLREETALHMTT